MNLKPAIKNGDIITTLTVGSCAIQSPELTGSPGFFEFTLSEQAKQHGCLKVEPSKGQLAGGIQIPVSIVFESNKYSSYERFAKIRSVQDIIVCKLKGGLNVQNDAPESRDIQLKLNLSLDSDTTTHHNSAE